MTVLTARVLKCRNMRPGWRAGNIEKIDVVQQTMPNAMRTTKWVLIRDQTNIRVGSASSANALNTTERSLLQLSRPQLVTKSPTIQRTRTDILTLILRRSRTGTVWFYTSTSNKRAARPKLYTKSLTRNLKRMYSRLTLVRIYINL